ncbi:IS481 family transposase [Agromyces flavus]|uniref:Transposase InsO and inactivated derivatives n=1 Tax=Agromyces flavus TaxID=589382 RepID=A0A1H1NP18_9MICO|nr:IS481 family transposase [Agromyces flavus]SDS00653.1 Transposase InsO and inactivated derivatives [Agromyces flavus]
MSRGNRNRVIAHAIVDGGLTAADAAARFGISRQWASTLANRYREGGDDALEPRSRKPRRSPTRTTEGMRQRILTLRTELAGAGLDDGAESIRDRLTRAGEKAPSVSTIWRILRAEGVVIPQPQKRPRSSIIRFEAVQPNETWQSDFTHWPLADGTDVEIISWLDDHSRYLVRISAHARVTGPIVVATFTSAADTHGLPASTLTDNGMVYTTRFARGGSGPNGFETLLGRLGITQKNGSPAHPQTQGKIERFHQTLKQWLRRQPPADTIQALNQQLEHFQELYNEHRPHRAINRSTPGEAYRSLPKAEPRLRHGDEHWRVRYDTVDNVGTITIRYAGRLRHLGIGRAHAGTPVILLMNGPQTLVTARHTGELLAEHIIDPGRDYQPRKRQKPLPKEGLHVNDVPEHL